MKMHKQWLNKQKLVAQRYLTRMKEQRIRDELVKMHRKDSNDTLAKALQNNTAYRGLIDKLTDQGYTVIDAKQYGSRKDSLDLSAEINVKEQLHLLNSEGTNWERGLTEILAPYVRESLPMPNTEMVDRDTYKFYGPRGNPKAFVNFNAGITKTSKGRIGLLSKEDIGDYVKL